MSARSVRVRSHVLVLFALLGVVALYVHLCLGVWHYTNDDAYITFRYSRFLALGRGPYFNLAEHVEGYTNFLFMTLMAGWIRLFGPEAPLFAAKCMGVVFGAATILVVFVTVRSVAEGKGLAPEGGGGAWAGVVAGGVTAVHPGFALHGVNGLETMLFTFLLVTGLALALVESSSRRWRGSGLAFAAAALTRPEGPALFAVVWTAQAIIAWRDEPVRNGSAVLRNPVLWANGGIVALTVVLHVLLRLHLYDGEWLPNTYYAKAAGFWKLAAWEYVWRGLGATTFGAAGLAAALGGLWLRPPRRSALPLFGLAIASVGLPFVTGPDWMPGWRFVVPCVPLVAAVVVLGWTALLERLAPRRFEWAPVLLLAVVPALAWVQAEERRILTEYTRIRADGYENGHFPLAYWLKEVSAPGEAIALMDVGIVGYVCIDQTIIDITGLTDRRIAKSPGPFLWKRYDPAYVLRRRPRFIVLVFKQRDSGAASSATDFIPWTLTEKRLYDHPLFQGRYVAPTSAGPKASVLDRFASDVGAVRVYAHDYPGNTYWLAVFEDRTSGS